MNLSDMKFAQILVFVCGTLHAVAQGQQVRVDRVQETAKTRAEDSGFNPSVQRLIVFQDPDSTLSLKTDHKALTIVIERKGRSATTVTLPAEVAQVNEIRKISEGRAVVLGMANGAVSEAIILDIEAGTISDHFLAYSPSLSPDGRYIAFVKFYPSHFVEGTTDQYLLYNVTQNAAMNRQSPGAADDQTNVGLLLYPLNSQNADVRNTGVPETQTHHMAAQDFYWDSSSRRYVFADEQMGELKLVAVDIGTGNTPPSVRAFPIIKRQICAPLNKDNCQISLNDGQFSTRGIVAHFRGVGVDASLDTTLEILNSDLLSPR